MFSTRSVQSAASALALGLAALAVAPVASANGWQVGVGGPVYVQRAPVVVAPQPVYRPAPVYVQPGYVQPGYVQPGYVQSAPVYVHPPQVIGYAPQPYYYARPHHHHHHGYGGGYGNRYGSGYEYGYRDRY